MSGIIVKIDKFNGRNSFNLWQIKMQTLLKQQGIRGPLSEKKSEAADLEALKEKAFSTILLCLADEIIIEVSDEKTTPSL